MSFENDHKEDPRNKPIVSSCDECGDSADVLTNGLCNSCIEDLEQENF